MNDSIEEFLRHIQTQNPEVLSPRNDQPTSDFITVRFSKSSYEGSNQVLLDGEGDETQPRSLRNIGVYLTADEYLLAGGTEVERAELRARLIDHILQRVDIRSLLLNVKTIGVAIDDRAKLDSIIQDFSKMLSDKSRAELLEALETRGRAFAVRQGVLAAYREVLLRGQLLEQNSIDPGFAAIVLIHSVLSSDDVLGMDDGPQIGELPGRLALHLVANQDFNSRDDVIAMFDRTIRLWQDFGPQYASKLGGQEPLEILFEATGLEIKDLLALAFGVWAYDVNWRPDAPSPLNSSIHANADQNKVCAFLDVTSASVEDLKRDLVEQRSQWDFLPLEQRPIIKIDDGLLLVDAKFIMSRVTSGLFYFVFDYLKGIDEPRAKAWQSVWGLMVESLAKENLRPLAPMLLGDGKTFFDDNDLKRAYPGDKQADVVIDFGETIVAFEIVSGHLTIKTRLNLDTEAFFKDMEKIAFKKIRQLSKTASNILSDPSRLTGAGEGPTHFQPIVIAGGGFPINVATTLAIENYIKENGLLDDARILPIAFIDLADLELLESLAELNLTVVEAVSKWRTSEERDQPLRNWVHNQPDMAIIRPSRMDRSSHDLFDEFAPRLNITEVKDLDSDL